MVLWNKERSLFEKSSAKTFYNDYSLVNVIRKAPSESELSAKLTDGERAKLKITLNPKLSKLLPSRFTCHLPLGGRLLYHINSSINYNLSLHLCAEKRGV